MPRASNVFRRLPIMLISTKLGCLGVVVLATLPTPLALRDAQAFSFTQLSGTDVTTDAGGSRSVNWVDADGDGDLDLYVSNGGSLGENNFAYWNEGGVFEADTLNTIAMDGLRAVGSSWADFDNDGDADLFVTSWYFEKNALFVNEGSRSFTRVTAGHPAFDAVAPSTYSESATWADPDADGDLDLFVANSGNVSSHANIYFQNNGDGTFTRLTTPVPVMSFRFGRHATFCDIDMDGDEDLFVVNERNQHNQLYWNQLVETGSLSWIAETASPLVTDGACSFGATWGDYDNDGDFDVFVANFGNEDNTLYRNELSETGNSTFVEESGSIVSNDNGYSIAGTWGDFDNDGDLDLLVDNAFAPGSTPLTNYLYENDGAGSFTKVTTGALVIDTGWSYGAAAADYDDDGDLDLVFANCLDGNEENSFFRNDEESSGKHWLVVECRGVTSNRSGIGAQVAIKANLDGTPRWQRRFVSSQESYCGQNLRLHFGLGNAGVVDSLVVQWPNGTQQVLTNVSVDQKLTIVETSPASVDDVEPAPGAPASLIAPHDLRVHPNPFHGDTTFRFDLPAAARVRLVVTDVAGRTVDIAEWRDLPAGTHSWPWRAQADRPALPSGIYFARIEQRHPVVTASRTCRFTQVR